MEHPTKICDDNEEILGFKKFVQIGFKFIAGQKKKFDPGFLSDSISFERKNLYKKGVIQNQWLNCQY